MRVIIKGLLINGKSLVSYLAYLLPIAPCVQESSLVTYHSQFCKVECETAAGIPILPLRQMGAGPAPKSDESVDIIDEAITLFRSTILFKNFSPKGPADKIIVYLTVFI